MDASHSAGRPFHLPERFGIEVSAYSAANDSCWRLLSVLWSFVTCVTNRPILIPRGTLGHSSATFRGERMAIVKMLVVDDNDAVRLSLCKILENHGFHVTCAADVTEALRYIAAEKFDVLLSDLHMPGAGDGRTVVSAMRRRNPEALTLLLSAFPEMSAAANAILLQTDEILVKPMQIPDLIEAITQRLAKGPLHKRKVETLAAILARTTQSSIDDWYATVETEDLLMAIPLSREARCKHLPQVFLDLAERLQSFKRLGSKELKSESALKHGTERHEQGYTAAMMVEESRILQVTIFHTLQQNLGTIDFSILLLGVMTIADEVDSQLSQAMTSYTAEFAGLALVH